MPTHLSEALRQRLRAPGWRRELGRAWRRLQRDCFDRYRPELGGSPQARELAARIPDNTLAVMLRGNQAALDGDFGRAKEL